MKFSAFLQRWLDEEVRYKAKRHTQIRYRETADRYILPRIGGYETEQIDLPLIQSFREQLLAYRNPDTARPLSAGTVRNIMAILYSALSYARRCGVPLPDIPKLRPLPHSTRPIVIFSKEEQKRIEREAAGGRDNHFGIVLCLYTGLRLGELLALTWEDIDFKNAFLSVRKTSYTLKDDDGVFRILTDLPKTASSLRVIPLPEAILARLLAVKEKSRSPYVVSTRKGNAVQNRAYQKTYERLLARAGVPYKNFHVLRHTFASRALECGMDIKTLSEILGHRTPAITMDRYVHSLMETKRKMLDLLAENMDIGK